MPKIIVQPDCGNAPRKLFLKDFVMAIAEGNMDYLEKNVPEKIIWEIIGSRIMTGKEDFLNKLRNHVARKAKELAIETIITHGPDACVSGKIIRADKSQYGFCDIYRFKGAGGFVLHSITTFLIKM